MFYKALGIGEGHIVELSENKILSETYFDGERILKCWINCNFRLLHDIISIRSTQF